MTKASTAYGACIKAGMDMWMLSAEAGMVMTLPMARIPAGGSAGAAEAEMMVTEKVSAAIELQIRLMTNALGVTPLGATQGTLKHYRRKVSANNKRLTDKRTPRR
jgi:hypothetical protein